MLIHEKALVCRGCPQRATCRKLFEPSAVCEHWPSGATPGIVTLAARASIETSRWIMNGARLADAMTRASRQQICNACPHWDPHAWLETGSCRHPSCHCTRAKLALATSRCPMGKWLPV